MTGSTTTPAQSHRRSPLLVGSFVYVVILCALELAVTAVLAAILLDFAIAGSMREAMRYTIVDAPVQFAFIAPALVLACAAVNPGGGSGSVMLSWIASTRTPPSTLSLLVRL